MVFGGKRVNYAILYTPIDGNFIRNMQFYLNKKVSNVQYYIKFYLNKKFEKYNMI